MKLTESQARRAIRKWLFEYATDSGVSRRASTDDKVAGTLGDDRLDQPFPPPEPEMPIMPMDQMSVQLTQERRSQKLRKLKNLLQGKFRFLLSESKELRSWEKHKSLVFLRKVKKVLEKHRRPNE